ncbi:cytokine-like nuclear factor N-PAC [Corticium candelabrum]|uniref:cytokine-like nuclear factor N-PAC n=1 Tax=Corticium candelabrum TaxID=121492 RepID=UPI002E2735B0|nr:cytokine-like nuclear factor N-PAC [Corticium candelabrum]
MSLAKCATIPEKSIKAINEDRVKMVKQNKTVKFLQAVAEVNTLSPPPASMLNALQDLLNKKGKKGKKRKGEEIATGTKDDAKKAKVEKSNPSILAQTKVSTNKSKKLTTSSQEGTLNSPPSGDKNETLIASFERSQSETDGDSRVYSSDMAKQYIKYGFIGLGAMGYEMVCNLLKGGCNVTVWNRTVAKVDELVGKGARKGDSAAAVAKQCDVTFACLSSPEICKEVVIGPNGIINGISSGKGYVEMSTVDPETSKELEKHWDAFVLLRSHQDLGPNMFVIYLYVSHLISCVKHSLSIIAYTCYTTPSRVETSQVFAPSPLSTLSIERLKKAQCMIRLQGSKNPVAESPYGDNF